MYRNKSRKKDLISTDSSCYYVLCSKQKLSASHLGGASVRVDIVKWTERFNIIADTLFCRVLTFLGRIRS